MTNFDALKAIYEALGGEEEISGTNLDALKAIAEVAGSGGGGGGKSNVYCIPGDYDDGDTISQEYLRAANSVMNEGGLAFLKTSGGDNSGVWVCTYSIGCVSITGSSHTLDVDWDTGEVSTT